MRIKGIRQGHSEALLTTKHIGRFLCCWMWIANNSCLLRNSRFEKIKNMQLSLTPIN